MALRQLPPSPFLRGSFPNPLMGSHLSWFTDVSEAMQGATGNGPLVDADGNTVGNFKAIGGIVHGWFSVTAGIHVIQLPTIQFSGPCHLSNGGVVWPDPNGNITVSSDIDVNGWITFRG